MASRPSQSGNKEFEDPRNCDGLSTKGVASQNREPVTRAAAIDEPNIKKSTDTLIAEMSSAFNRFVSHFRDLEAAATQENVDDSNQSDEVSSTLIASKDVTGNRINSGLPHQRELHLALSRAGLTWDDYLRAMRQIEEDSSLAQSQDSRDGHLTDLSAVSSDERSSVIPSHEHGDRPVFVQQSSSSLLGPPSQPDCVLLLEGDSTSLLSASTPTTTKDDRITAKSSFLETVELNSTKTSANDQSRRNLERQLEEARNKKWAFYNDILKSTEQWRTNSHELEPTTTTTSSRWWDALRESEEQRLTQGANKLDQEEPQLSSALTDTLELQLAHERNIIKMRMAELERFRAEEEARLKRLERMALEARLSRNHQTAIKMLRSRNSHFFRSQTPSESSYTIRPKTADNLPDRTAMSDCYKRFSLPPSTYSMWSTEKADSTWPMNYAPLKVNGFQSKARLDGPVRPVSVATVYSTERQMRPFEVENVLTPETRPKSVDAQRTYSPVTEAYRGVSRSWPKSIGTVRTSNRDCLKIKHIKSKANGSGTVRPATATGAYSTEREMRPLEMDSVLTPIGQNGRQFKSVRKRSSSESRRMDTNRPLPHHSSKRSVSAKRGISSRDSDTSTVHLPILFTKKLDKALEETSPYALPEATYNTKMAYSSTCIDEDIFQKSQVQATGDLRQIKYYGPVEPHSGGETKQEQLSEVQFLPEIDRHCTAVQLQSQPSDWANLEKSKRASTLPRGGTSSLTPKSDVARSRTPPGDFEAPGHQTAPALQPCNIPQSNPSSPLPLSHIVPVPIDLGGKQIAAGNLATASSIVCPAGEIDLRPEIANGSVNGHKRLKQKSYQIKIQLDLNRALRHYDQQRQQFLSSSQSQVPEGQTLPTVEQTCEIVHERVTERSCSGKIERSPTRNGGKCTHLDSMPSIPLNPTQCLDAIRSIEIVPVPTGASDRPGSSHMQLTCVAPETEATLRSSIWATAGMQHVKRAQDRRAVCDLDRIEAQIGQPIRERQTQHENSSALTAHAHRNLAGTTSDPDKVPATLHHADELHMRTSELVREVAEGEIDPMDAFTVLRVPGHSRSNQLRCPSQTKSTSKSHHMFDAALTTDTIHSQNTNANKSVGDRTKIISGVTPYQLNQYAPNDTSCSTAEMRMFHSEEKTRGVSEHRKQCALSRVIKRPVSVTYPELKSFSESTEALHSVTPQVAKLIEGGVNKRPKSRGNKNNGLCNSEQASPIDRVQTPSFIAFKNQIDPFSPRSPVREDELSKSSSHDDNTSSQIRPTHEQLCLWSTSDPINATDSSPTTGNTSRNTSCSGRNSTASLNKAEDCTIVGSNGLAGGLNQEMHSSVTTNRLRDTVSAEPPIGLSKSTNPSVNEANLLVTNTMIHPAENGHSRKRLTVELGSIGFIKQPNVTQEARMREICSSEQTVGISARSSRDKFFDYGPHIDQELMSNFQVNNSESRGTFCVENAESSAIVWTHSSGNNNNDDSIVMQKNGNCSHNPLLDNRGNSQYLESTSMGRDQDLSTEIGSPPNDVELMEIPELQREWLQALERFRSSVTCRNAKRSIRTNPRKRIRNANCKSDIPQLSTFLASAQKLAGSKSGVSEKSQVERDDSIAVPFGLNANQIDIRFDANCASIKFDQLRVVQLTRCNLTPDMLMGLDQLPQLEALNLSHNQLNYLGGGTFPKLIVLDVSNNYFEELEHLCGPYPSLQKLHIRSNLLSAVDQSQQRDLMPRLHVLDMRDNLITQSVNIQLRNSFTGQLNLGGNQLRQLDNLFCLRHLVTDLDLSGNSLHELPEDGLHGPILKYLDLSQNNLQSLDPLSKSWLPNLHTLKADGNRIDKIPTVHSSKLAVLSLQNNKITDLSHLATALKRCLKLRMLNLQHNPCCLNKQFRSEVRQTLSNLDILNDEPTESCEPTQWSDNLVAPVVCSNCLPCCYHEELLCRWPFTSVEC